MYRETSAVTRPAPSEAYGGYLVWLERTGRKPGTKRAYADRVRPFVDWLEVHADRYGDALHDPDVRNYAARDYRRMLIERRLAVATVALHMAAISDLFRWSGMDRPSLPKTEVEEADAQGLTEDELRAVLRAAERRGPRDYALTCLLFYTAIRVGEACGANVDDLWITPRDGEIQVIGKGDKPRKIDLSTKCRAALAPWLRERAALPYATPTGPLFYTREGNRLTVDAAEHAIERVGLLAGLVEDGAKRSWLHPHALRHTWATRYMQGDPERAIPPGDIVTAKTILGHAHVRTTARYATPSRQRRRDAVESVDIEI